MAGKPPNIRPYTVYIYGSGQPLLYTSGCPHSYVTKTCDNLRYAVCNQRCKSTNSSQVILLDEQIFIRSAGLSLHFQGWPESYIYIRCIRPYIWWFPCQKHRTHTVYKYGYGQPYTFLVMLTTTSSGAASWLKLTTYRLFAITSEIN